MSRAQIKSRQVKIPRVLRSGRRISEKRATEIANLLADYLSGCKARGSARLRPPDDHRDLLGRVRWHEPDKAGPLNFDQFCRESRDLIVAGLKQELANYISDCLKVEWARARMAMLDASPIYAGNFLLRHSDPAYGRATMGASVTPEQQLGNLESFLDDLHHFHRWTDGTYGGGWAWSTTLSSHFEAARLAQDGAWVGLWNPELIIGHVEMLIAELEQMPRKLESEEED